MERLTRERIEIKHDLMQLYERSKPALIGDLGARACVIFAQAEIMFIDVERHILQLIEEISQSFDSGDDPMYIESARKLLVSGIQSFLVNDPCMRALLEIGIIEQEVRDAVVNIIDAAAIKNILPKDAEF